MEHLKVTVEHLKVKDIPVEHLKVTGYPSGTVKGNSGTFEGNRISQWNI
mgnify:CR=1 FL=1